MSKSNGTWGLDRIVEKLKSKMSREQIRKAAKLSRSTPPVILRLAYRMLPPVTVSHCRLSQQQEKQYQEILKLSGKKSAAKWRKQKLVEKGKKHSKKRVKK
jgi:hypothetical protein